MSEILKCWSCGHEMSFEERSNADGNCPKCNCEIDLETEMTQLIRSNKKALHIAISAIYSDDSSDYKSSLLEIVEVLGGDEALQLLNKDPSQAFHIYDA